MADPVRPAPSPTPAGPSGYVIPRVSQSNPPQTTPPQIPPSGSTPGVSPPPSAPNQSTTTVPVIREAALVGDLTQNGAIIGAAIMVGLALVFFFLRGAVRSHLITNKAPLSAANGASWALFTFLLVAAFTIVFGLLGQFWTVMPFIAPLGALSLVTLILFIVLFNSATRTSR